MFIAYQKIMMTMLTMTAKTKCWNFIFFNLWHLPL